MKIYTFIFLLNRFLAVQCQWYEVKQHQIETLGNELASKPLPARSSTECILKCRIKCMESFFVAKEKQCYCLSSHEMPNFEAEGVLLRENLNAQCIDNKVLKSCNILSFLLLNIYCPGGTLIASQYWNLC